MAKTNRRDFMQLGATALGATALLGPFRGLLAAPAVDPATGVSEATGRGPAYLWPGALHQIKRR